MVTLRFEGQRLHNNLKCVLNFDGEVLETAIEAAEILSYERAACKFDGLYFFQESTSNTTLILRDYNAENNEIVTESEPVQVIFVPALKIWLSSLEETFYFDSDLDAQIKLVS